MGRFAVRQGTRCAGPSARILARSPMRSLT